VDGILVPGGFGERGTEGKVLAIEYARTKQVPFFGICLGMQMAAVEFARNVCGLKNANSTEFVSDCKEPVIHLMEEQKTVHKKGGTMRLGACPCTVTKGTRAFEAYNQTEISERHRHRYEFNNTYREMMTTKGLVLSGINQQKDLVEIIELPEHPGFWPASFTRSSNQNRWFPILFSAPLLELLWPIAASANQVNDEHGVPPRGVSYDTSFLLLPVNTDC
jgi:CTP synthase